MLGVFFYAQPLFCLAYKYGKQFLSNLCVSYFSKCLHPEIYKKKQRLKNVQRTHQIKHCTLQCVIIIVQYVRINQTSTLDLIVLQTSTLDLIVLHLYKLLLQKTIAFDKSSSGQIINLLNYSFHEYSLVNYHINVTGLLLILISYPIQRSLLS